MALIKLYANREGHSVKIVWLPSEKGYAREGICPPISEVVWCAVKQTGIHNVFINSLTATGNTNMFLQTA